MCLFSVEVEEGSLCGDVGGVEKVAKVSEIWQIGVGGLRLGGGKTLGMGGQMGRKVRGAL